MFNIAGFNIAEDICSMTEFKRRTVILTTNGKADIVVQDAASCQRLLDRIHASENGQFTSSNGR